MKQAEVGEEISSSEIARLAQSKPATVSNWRRRHEDFPRPVGGTAARPLFSRTEVVAWLKANDKLSEGADVEAFRRDYEEMMAKGVPLATALAAWYRLTDRDSAARMGVEPLPERLGPDSIHKRANYVGGYQELREHLASYPAPYPEVGRILAEKPHATNVWAPAAKVMARPQRPSALIRLVLELASPKGTERLLELAAERADFLRIATEAYPDADVRGVESDPAAASKALISAAAAGVAVKLTTMDPFSRTAAPAEADVVFADGVWGKPLEPRRLVGDPRFPEPIGVRQRDWAWAYLAIHHLSPAGRGFLTLPVTALGQGNAKGWRNLVLQGCIEAVIALPAGLHPGTHQSFQTCLLVLRKPTTDPSAGVLMMSAEKSPLDTTDQTSRQLTAAYRDWRSGEAAAAPGSDIAKVVPITTLARNQTTLVPRRWLSPSPGDLGPEEITSPANSARDEVARLLQSLPKASAMGKLHREPSGRNFTSVNDLILGHRIQIVTPVPANTSHAEFDEHPEMTPVVTARSANGLDPDEIGLLRSYAYVNAEERKKIGDDSLLARRGDVIVSPLAVRGRVLARAVADDDRPGFVSRSEIHLRVVLADELDPDYLALMLQSTWNAAFFTGESSAKFNVRDLQIPQASLEQQRAAAQGLKALDTARQHADALAAALDHLKKTAIDAVATGRYSIADRSPGRE